MTLGFRVQAVARQFRFQGSGFMVEGFYARLRFQASGFNLVASVLMLQGL